MKLYTEKQVKRMIDLATFTYNSEDKILFSQTPIELPNDEEIEERKGFEYPSKQQDAFEEGAKWMRNKILNNTK